MMNMTLKIYKYLVESDNVAPDFTSTLTCSELDKHGDKRTLISKMRPCRKNTYHQLITTQSRYSSSYLFQPNCWCFENMYNGGNVIVLLKCYHEIKI